MSFIVPRDKPKRCTYCNFFNREYRDCKLQRVVYDSLDKQYKNCPLTELPPHGRLGDLDKLYAMVNEADDYGADIADVLRLIIDAPTVIEAEGETDGR